MKWPWTRTVLRPDRKPVGEQRGLVCTDAFKDDPEHYHVACKVPACICWCHKPSPAAKSEEGRNG